MPVAHGVPEEARLSSVDTNSKRPTRPKSWMEANEATRPCSCRVGVLSGLRDADSVCGPNLRRVLHVVEISLVTAATNPELLRWFW